MTKPLASFSLDLDNLWSYMKVHGDAGWESYPSYLDTVCPIIVEQMRRHDLAITVFVVGQDAALPKNRDALRSLVDAGHDLGNHSFSHEPWFHDYTPAEVEREIADAEEHIERATGQRPRGFRGPGFSLSTETLRVLQRRGYLYDASTLPTFLGPLLRAYYFWQSKGMSTAEREKRSRLYGTSSEVLRPITPYLWDLPEGPLLEIPVTTMPLARVPIHMSYLIYLASFSELAAHAYLRTTLALCRATKVEPSFLLHPLDFISGDRLDALGFFPGMKTTTTESKLELFAKVMTQVKLSFEPVSMERHARALLDRGQLALRPAAAQ